MPAKVPRMGEMHFFQSVVVKLLQFCIKIGLTKNYGQIPFPLFLAFPGVPGM